MSKPPNNSRLLVLIFFVFPVLFMGCSRNDSNIERYFNGLLSGSKDGPSFPYNNSRIDLACAIQAYQNKVLSKENILMVEAINKELLRVKFRGEEGAWYFIVLSGSQVFIHRVNRYKSPLSSPDDSDHKEWATKDGRKSQECSTGKTLDFSVVLNIDSTARRVAIVSNYKEK